MKRIVNTYTVLCMLLFSMLPCSIMAQDGQESVNNKERDFYFAYIDHEPDTPVPDLIDKLDKLRQSAQDYGSVLVIFLANGTEPLVSFTNLKDFKPDLQRDNDEAYETICSELQSRPFHEASTADLGYIQEIIGPAGAYPLFNMSDQDDPMLFQSVKIMFFVGRQFWWQTLNEDVIALLYQNLNLQEYMSLYRKTQLGYEIWRNKDLPLPKEDFGLPRFGSHNYGKINENQKIQFIGYPN